MQAEVDRITVDSLPDRYQRSRSNIWKWIKELGIETEKDDRKAYINQDQLELLDRMSELLNQGTTIQDAVTQLIGSQLIVQDQPADLSYSPTGQSYETIGQIGQLITLLQQHQTVDPLQKFRQLDEIAERGWLLSSNEIKDLIGSKPKGDGYDRFGFRFTRSGRNGNQAAWKVSKNV